MTTIATCFKVANLIRIDANTMQVQGLRIFVDTNANGKYDVIWREGDFLIVDATGLNTLAKVGVLVKARVQAIIALQPWVPVVQSDATILAAIGKAFDLASLSQVTDPDTSSALLDTAITGN